MIRLQRRKNLKNLIKKYKSIVLIVLLLLVVINSFALQYLSTSSLFLCILCLIFLLEDFFDFIYFYRKIIITIFIGLHILLTVICYMNFKNIEYFNMATSYFNVVVLKTNEYSAISKPQGRKNFEKSLDLPYKTGHVGRSIDSFRYLVDRKETLDEQMLLISQIVGNIASYEYFYDNYYRINLEIEGTIYIEINSFSNFIIITFG